MPDRPPLTDDRERLIQKLEGYRDPLLAVETWPARSVDLAWRSSIFILCVLPLVLAPASGLAAGALIICSVLCSVLFWTVSAMATDGSPSRRTKTILLFILWCIILTWLAA